MLQEYMEAALVAWELEAARIQREHEARILNERDTASQRRKIP